MTSPSDARAVSPTVPEELVRGPQRSANAPCFEEVPMVGAGLRPEGHR